MELFCTFMGSPADAFDCSPEARTPRGAARFSHWALPERFTDYHLCVHVETYALVSKLGCRPLGMEIKLTAQVHIVNNVLAYITGQTPLGQHPGFLGGLVVLAFIDAGGLRQHFIGNHEVLELQQSVPVNLIPANPEVIFSGGPLPVVGPVIRQVLIEHGQERPGD